MRRIVLVALGLTLVTALLGAPSGAEAATTTRQDRRHDAPAAIDIVHVRYTNAADAVSQVVKVRDLKANSNVYLFIGLPGQVSIYVARLWRQNGRVHKRLMYQTIEGPGPAAHCRLGGQWRPADNTAVVSVPWRCLDMRQGSLQLEAGTLRDQDRQDFQPFDEAAPAVVRRG